ncbi:hypothetical protein V2K32_18295, partial [Pseudomonas alliivorans]|nr:hypothetical protein [Pseudomonas alliivorans]
MARQFQRGLADHPVDLCFADQLSTGVVPRCIGVAQGIVTVGVLTPLLQHPAQTIQLAAHRHALDVDHFLPRLILIMSGQMIPVAARRLVLGARCHGLGHDPAQRIVLVADF